MPEVEWSFSNFAVCGERGVVIVVGRVDHGLAHDVCVVVKLRLAMLSTLSRQVLFNQVAIVTNARAVNDCIHFLLALCLLAVVKGDADYDHDQDEESDDEPEPDQVGIIVIIAWGWIRLGTGVRSRSWFRLIITAVITAVINVITTVVIATTVVSTATSCATKCDVFWSELAQCHTNLAFGEIENACVVHEEHISKVKVALFFYVKWHVNFLHRKTAIIIVVNFIVNQQLFHW